MGWGETSLTPTIAKGGGGRRGGKGRGKGSRRGREERGKGRGKGSIGGERSGGGREGEYSRRGEWEGERVEGGGASPSSLHPFPLPLSPLAQCSHSPPLSLSSPERLDVP